MKLWSDFFDYVLPDVPGCPQDVAALAIRNAAIEFFDSTGVYVVSHVPLDVSSGQSTYQFVPPSGWDISQVRSMWVDGKTVTPSGEDDLAAMYGEWTSKTGCPRHFMQETQNDVRLVPIPDRSVVGGLHMRVVLRPARDAIGFSTDWVFDTWVDTIANGAKGALMAMPAKPWSNPPLGLHCTKQFTGAVGAAKITARRAMTRGATSVQMNPAA